MPPTIPSPISPSDPYYDLGSYTPTLVTNTNTTSSLSSSPAEIWFTRGLIWSYAFHHEEAACCFLQAISHSPTFTLAYWGYAYCLGPNYNKPWDFFDDEERRDVVGRCSWAVDQARRCAEGLEEGQGRELVRGLVRALGERYPKEGTVDGGEDGKWDVWNQRYAEAMREVWEGNKRDLDVSALYVDALMNLTPWALWDIRTGREAEGTRTGEIKELLESAIGSEGGKEHPGLLHLYIHLMEMSPRPEEALKVADRLRGLVPDAGHLNHMPTHLDIQLGRYKEAMEWNRVAIEADEKYLEKAGAVNFYTLYRSHDYHFRIYAAMFAGNYGVAIETVERMEKSLSEDVLRVKSPPMADWLEGFLSVRIHVLVRFGKWEELSQIEERQDEELYAVTNAFIRYGRGVAFAALGQTDKAEAEREAFGTRLTSVPESRTLFNNKCVDLLKIAEAMLNGEVEYRKGNVERGFESLRKAIELDDNLPYDEPWGWMQPTRHAYGALLLEQGRVEQAVKVYEADLGVSEELPRQLRHPGNVWALSGYEECLRRLGRRKEADVVAKELQQREGDADVQVRSSCFCRREPRGV